MINHKLVTDDTNSRERITNALVRARSFSFVRLVKGSYLYNHERITNVLIKVLKNKNRTN